jgi:PKD repeat protein
MNKLVNNRWLLSLAILFTALACDETEDPPKPAIASFQFEVDAADYRKVTFKNFSQEAVSYAWDFGDNSAVSSEEEPTHIYEGEGTYTVTLTATGAGGDEAVKEEEVIITDPNKALKVLTGEVSKTWKLLRDVSKGVYPLQVGPADRSAVWFAYGQGNALGARPCLLNDEFIFKLNGDYQYKSNGDFWGEFGVWSKEECKESIPANYVNKDNVNVAAWGDGNHKFTYDITGKTLTVTGLGAYVALTKAATNSEVTVPQASVTYKVVKLVDAAVDTLVLETTIGTTGYWRMALVHYDNPADEPAMPTLPPPLGSIDVVDMDFESTIPTFTTFGGSSAEVVDNPTKAGINTSNKVLKSIHGNEPWAGFFTDLSGTLDFTNKKTMKIKVLAPVTGAFRFKLENIANVSELYEVDVNVPTANAWVEISVDLSTVTSNKFARIVLFPGWNVPNAGTFYIDDIKLVP